MVSLPTKSTRDSIGIDSYDRGAVWAALMLRSIAAELPAPYTQAVRVTADFQKVETVSRTLPDGGGTVTFAFPRPIFQFQASIPYSRESAMRYGGNWIGTAMPIADIACPPTGISFPRLGVSEIAQEPVWVTSLEQYLVWCAWKIHSKQSHFVRQDPNFKGLNSIQIRFLDEAAYPAIQIAAQLAFDLDLYYAYGSVIAALQPIYGTTINLGGGTPATQAQPDAPSRIPGGETGSGFNVRVAARATAAFGDFFPLGDFSGIGNF